MTLIPEPTQRTVAAIDAWVESQRDAPRHHLGASLLGHDCDRYLWLSFRWAIPDNATGRLLRLFRRGQREEIAFVEYLRAVGVQIHHTSHPFANDGGQLYVDLGCHVGGSLDGIIESGLLEAPNTRHVAEFKTHGADSFAFLQKHGIIKGMCETRNLYSKTLKKHYVQMQLYMHGTGINRAFYLAVNKNNDELYSERVAFDQACASWALNRGHRITQSDELPAPMPNASANWYECKMCACYDFCWQTHWSKEINCRTCAHFTASPDGTCTCNAHGKEKIDAGITSCNAHVMLPSLVPWPFAGGTSNGQRAYYSIDGQRVLNGLEGNDPDNPLDTDPEAAASISTEHIFQGIRTREQLAQLYKNNSERLENGV